MDGLDDGETRKQIQESAKMFELLDYEDNKINTFVYDPKWLRSFFKTGKLPGFLYNAYVHKMVVF